MSIPVGDLHFDPENPRLPSHLQNATESEVLAWMLDNATLLELMGSIGEQGYFAGEPLMVVPRPAGGFNVIEGNRRLAAVKLLINPDLAPTRQKAVREASLSASKEKPALLPSLSFPRREDILENLGFRHVTGIKPWPPLAKARFLEQLKQSLPDDLNDGEALRILAKSIGSRTDYVASLLTGKMVYDTIEDENFFRIRQLNESTLEFSLLTTALFYKNIAEYIGLTSGRSMDISALKVEALRELTSWIFEKNSENRTRIGESRNLADLNEVVRYPAAIKAFRDGRPLSEALLLTGAPTESFRNSIREARARLDDALSLVAHDLDLALTDADELRAIRRLGSSILDIVMARLRPSEEED